MELTIENQELVKALKVERNVSVMTRYGNILVLISNIINVLIQCLSILSIISGVSILPFIGKPPLTSDLIHDVKEILNMLRSIQKMVINARAYDSSQQSHPEQRLSHTTSLEDIDNG